MPNTEKDRLLTEKSKYGNQANDFNGEKKDENTLKKANDFPQFQIVSQQFSVIAYSSPINKFQEFINSPIPDSFISGYDIPPESIS
ncbi:MAG: hypothetical protein QM764_24280 [Chitinophagaceae bacterium]